MLLEVRHLSKDFRLRSSRVGRSSYLSAVMDVSFALPLSGSLAIVGETGSGKTTVARIIVGLETPTKGEVLVDGSVLTPTPGPKERRRRARMMQMVFQNPMMSLDPKQRVRSILRETVLFHGLRSAANCDARIEELLAAVGLSPNLADSLPRQLSGGQCQRVAIALALAAEPELLVLDEPVSALDVSTQAQILNLLGDLQAQLGISLLIISHDLAVIRQLADEVVVMYKGRAVESGKVDAILSSPQQPYTRQLLDAVPERMGRLSGQALSQLVGSATAEEDKRGGFGCKPGIAGRVAITRPERG